MLGVVTARLPACARHRYWAPLISASATEIHSSPFHNQVASSAVSGRIAKPTANCWVTVFHLADLAGRHADALGPDERAVQADRELAGGDDHDRHHPEHVAAHEGEHRAEHQHLVGERVEEGAERWSTP